MSKTYTKDEVLAKLFGALTQRVDTLYKAEKRYSSDVIGHKSKTSDTKEFTIDVVADRLIKNIDLLNPERFKKSKRKSYKVDDAKREKPSRNKETREEEYVAKAMCKQKFDFIGEVFEHQIPLYWPLAKGSKATDAELAEYKEAIAGLGDIDLVSLNKSNKTVYLLELKKETNKETILRATLEAYTYWAQLNHEQFKSDYELGNVTIRPAVLVFKGGEQHKQYEASEKMRELIEKLGVKVFLMSGNCVKNNFVVHGEAKNIPYKA